MARCCKLSVWQCDCLNFHILRLFVEFKYGATGRSNSHGKMPTNHLARFENSYVFNVLVQQRMSSLTDSAKCMLSIIEKKGICLYSMSALVPAAVFKTLVHSQLPTKRNHRRRSSIACCRMIDRMLVNHTRTKKVPICGDFMLFHNVTKSFDTKK